MSISNNFQIRPEKRLVRISAFLLLIFPVFVFAAQCSNEGYSVVYVNGILTTQEQALKDTKFLENQFEQKANAKNVDFYSGYNQSHLAGGGDLIESVSQLLGYSVNDYDLKNILLQIYPEVTTQKILLVGHSQGTFYTNEIYNYLLAHGESNRAVGVYNIATPASFVLGGGTYLTSLNDKVINAVRELAPRDTQPLPANIDIPLSAEEAANKFGGHSFGGVYLAGAPERIVYEIGNALGKLTSTDTSTTDAGCFTPPLENFSYRAQELTFAVADPVAGGIVTSGKTIVAAGEGAYAMALAVTRTVGAALASVNEILTGIVRQNFETGGTALVVDAIPGAVVAPPQPTAFADTTGAASSSANQNSPLTTTTKSIELTSIDQNQPIAASTSTDPSSAPATTTASPTIIYSGGGGGGGGNSPTLVSSPEPVSSAETTSSIESSSSTITDETSTSTMSTPTSTDETAVSTSTIIFSQLTNDGISHGSHYNDNWYKLGSGFSGTLHSLTLQGKIDDASFANSHLWLKEFKDSSYTTLIRTITVSDNAPFTSDMATTTIDDLSITFKPYFYYRLDTLQNFQNRSIILVGTNTTGTAMYNEFIYGTGRVEHNYAFEPFMIGVGEAATSMLTPPPLATPGNLAFNFDQLAMNLGFSWSASYDPDWPENQLSYEINYSTSTILDPAGWVGVGSNLAANIPVVFGSTYTIGVRAKDSFGNGSSPATATWDFPAGFTPYLLGASANSASQDFQLATGGMLRSLEIFTKDFGTSSRNPDTNVCLVDFYEIADDGTANLLATSDAPRPRDGESGDYAYRGSGCAGYLTFTYASAPELLAGHHYRWLYHFNTDRASVKFYGTSTDTAKGAFSDATLANARFILSGDSGVLFGN